LGEDEEVEQVDFGKMHMEEEMKELMEMTEPD